MSIAHSHPSTPVISAFRISTIAALTNESHPELRAGEEFYGNETEEEYRRLFASGMRVRMGLVAYDRHGQVIRGNLRPVFMMDFDPLTVVVSETQSVQ